MVSLWAGSAVLNRIQNMKSQAEKLKSEQCRRILEALESGPKTTGELVKLCKLTAGSIESTRMSWLRRVALNAKLAARSQLNVEPKFDYLAAKHCCQKPSLRINSRLARLQESCSGHRKHP